MKKRKKRKIIYILLTIFIIIGTGIGGFYLYGLYKMSQLPSMTAEEMLAYTTKDNKAAVITVGIIQNDKITYDVYGENGKKLTPEEHLYEIGSITKTFTASLLCKAISEGRISLNRTIDEYLSLPEEDDYPTIKRLVTHTSGYKNYYFEKTMIPNFLHDKNVFDGISEEMLIERIGKINVDDADYAFKYSNFGMAAIGAVLEQVYDEDYTMLMNDFIAKDLGLTNTKMADGSGDLNNYWDWTESDAYLPVGALLSNISDMLKYAQLQLHEKPEYLTLAHTALAEVNASSKTNENIGIHIEEVGVGWMIDKENHITWHNGGTGDYNSYLGFDKEKQIAVVVLSNLPPNDRIPATVIGIEVLTSLQSE